MTLVRRLWVSEEDETVAHKLLDQVPPLLAHHQSTQSTGALLECVRCGFSDVRGSAPWSLIVIAIGFAISVLRGTIRSVGSGHVLDWSDDRDSGVDTRIALALSDLRRGIRATGFASPIDCSFRPQSDLANARMTLDTSAFTVAGLYERFADSSTGHGTQSRQFVAYRWDGVKSTGLGGAAGKLAACEGMSAPPS